MAFQSNRQASRSRAAHESLASKPDASLGKGSASISNGIELATRPPPPPSASNTFITDHDRLDRVEAPVGRDSVVLEEVADAGDSQAQIVPLELAPVDGGFGAWSFLFSAFCVETIVWGFPNAYGTFLDAYLRDPVYNSQPHSQFLLPLIGTLISGLMCLASPLVFPLLYRYPQHRRTGILVGTVLCFASLFGASYTTDVVNLVICQGVLYAIGGVLLYNPVIYYASEWFVARRGLASGVIYAGTAAGGLLLPLILPGLIERYGISATLRVLAIVFTGTLLPLLPFLKGRLPVARVTGPATRSAGANTIWVKNPRASLYMVATLLQGFGWFIPLIWLPTFATDLGLSQSNASLTLAVLNGASIIGRLATGVIADHADPWLLGFASLLASCLTTFILWGVLSNSLAGVVAFGLVYGTIAGGWTSMWSSLIRSVLKNDDPQLSTTMTGYLMLFRGLGNLITVPIASAMTSPQSHPTEHVKVGFEVGGGRFGNIIIYTGTCFAGATLISGIGWAMNMVKERKVSRGRSTT